jgi:hypothetical protein
MTMTVSRGCIICGWESTPRPYVEGATETLGGHECPVEPVARALCDAQRGEGTWDSWSTEGDWAKYGRRARRIMGALSKAGLRIVASESHVEGSER